MELNSATTEAAATENVAPVDDLNAIVEESMARIHETEMVPTKRPRGRGPGPRGPYAKTRRRIARQRSQLHAVKNDAPAPTQSSDPEPQIVENPPVDFQKILSRPLIVLSEIPARRLKVPELALTQDEAGMVAGAGVEVLNAYAPDLEKMDPKSAALLSFGIVVGSIFISKMDIYSKKKIEVVQSAPAPKPVQNLDPKPTDERKPEDLQNATKSVFAKSV